MPEEISLFQDQNHEIKAQPYIVKENHIFKDCKNLKSKIGIKLTPSTENFSC